MAKLLRMMCGSLMALTALAGCTLAAPSPGLLVMSETRFATKYGIKGRLVAAHRGASASAPENTIPAFEEAARQKTDLIEVDVQRTADHELVLMHDQTLERTTNGTGLVREQVYYGYVDQLDAGTWFAPTYQGTKVPTLHQALDLSRRTGIKLLLDLKHENLAWPVHRLLKAQGMEDKVIVYSGYLGELETFKRLSPNTPTIANYFPKAKYPSGFELWTYLEKGRHDGVSVGAHTLEPRLLSELHARGYLVATATVNDPEDMRHLFSNGVELMMTDLPDVAQRIARESAQPRPPRSNLGAPDDLKWLDIPTLGLQ